MTSVRPRPSLKTLQEKFNFTRSNFYRYAPAITEEDLDAIQEHLNSTDLSQDSEDRKFLTRQIALYYAFHKRNQAMAEKYFTELLALPLTMFEGAMALSFLAHTDSITGGFRQEPLDQYLSAMKTYDAMLANADTATPEELTEINRARGFNLRYIGMMYHRKSFDLLDAIKIAQTNKYAGIVEELTTQRAQCVADAYKNIGLAVECQEKLRTELEQTKSPDWNADQLKAYELALDDINADIAESLHLRLAIQIANANGNFEEALKTKALTQPLWPAAHPFRFISEQTFGSLDRNLGNLAKKENRLDEAVKLYESAEKHLWTAYRGHEHYFGTLIQADIAKTQDFLGNLYADQNKYGLSLYFLKLSLAAKAQVSQAMMPVTKDCIERVHLAVEKLNAVVALDAVNTYPAFVWNDESTFAAYAANLPAHLANLNIVAGVAFNPHTLDVYKEVIGQRLLELGTYYNVVVRKPEPALQCLLMAKALIKSDWRDLYECFSDQQLLFAANKSNPKVRWEIDYFSGKAAELYHAIIENFKNRSDVQDGSNVDAVEIVAFAYCLKALTEYELVEIAAVKAGDTVALQALTTSADSYKIAIDYYEKIRADHAQFHRVRNAYYRILGESKTQLPGHPVASKCFEELEKFWDNNTNPASKIFAARCYHAVGNFKYSQSDKGTAFHDIAIQKWEKAVTALSEANLDPGFIAVIKNQIERARKELASRPSPATFQSASDRKTREEDAALAAAAVSLTIQSDQPTTRPNM